MVRLSVSTIATWPNGHSAKSRLPFLSDGIIAIRVSFIITWFDGAFHGHQKRAAHVWPERDLILSPEKSCKWLHFPDFMWSSEERWLNDTVIKATRSTSWMKCYFLYIENNHEAIWGWGWPVEQPHNGLHSHSVTHFQDMKNSPQHDPIFIWRLSRISSRRPWEAWSCNQVNWVTVWENLSLSDRVQVLINGLVFSCWRSTFSSLCP